MIRFQFKPGLRFKTRDSDWTMVRRVPSGKLEFEDADGSRSAFTEDAVYRYWMGGEWVVDQDSLSAHANVIYLAAPRDLSTFTSTKQNGAKYRASYLAEITKYLVDTKQVVSSSPAKLQPAITFAAARLQDANPPHAATVWRWWKKYTATQDINHLVDKRAGRKATAQSEQRTIFDEAVESVYLMRQKYSAKDVADEIAHRYRQINQGREPENRIKPPSRATIYRWIKQLHYAVVNKAREGKAATDRELRVVLGGAPAKSILSRYEIDHTPVDLHLIDETTKLYCGRPWLTMIMDRKSRMVTGFYIGFHAPSVYSILYALRMAILPKTSILEKFADIKSPWPVRGIPDCIVCDNGMDLHAHGFEIISFELGIEMIYCAVAHPELKGAIERLFRTVSHSLFHKLPGSVFSNPNVRGDYPSEATAVLDIGNFTHVLLKWIVDVYHNTPHRGLDGKTPLQVWTEGEATRQIQLPCLPQQLHLLAGETHERKIFHYGVEYDRVRYNSPQLGAIRARSGGTPKVKIRVYEHDIGFISVLDPYSNEFIDVSAVDQTYAAGMTRHVHLLICAEITRRFNDNWQNVRLHDVKQEIMSIVEAALHAKRSASRKKALSVMAIDSEQVLQDRPDPIATSRRRLKAAPKPTEPIASGEEDVLPEFPVETRKAPRRERGQGHAG